MSEPFIAEIRIFAGNFAPVGWAFCDGTLLPVDQNTALFSLIGTTYGGDGRSTTALPDLQGRAPMHPGSGPGLTTRRLGQKTGAETVTLNANAIPAHNHSIQADDVDRAQSDSTDPTGRILGSNHTGNYKTGGTSEEDLVSMSSKALSNTGGGKAHNNMQPFLTMNFIIALTGLYPQRG